MAGVQKKGQKQHHKCPPLPEGAKQFHTPSYEPHDSFMLARRKWEAYVRRVGFLNPMPRRTR